jgi:hypothetical protein
MSRCYYKITVDNSCALTNSYEMALFLAGESGHIETLHNFPSRSACEHRPQRQKPHNSQVIRPRYAATSNCGYLLYQ